MLRGEGLSEKTRKAMSTSQVTVNTGVGWGLGWGLEEHADGAALWHWGHNDGYRAYVALYPVRDLAFVFFTNTPLVFCCTFRTIAFLVLLCVSPVFF